MAKSKSQERRIEIQKDAEEVTYRLSLTDSNNNAVQIDVNIADLLDSKECYTAVSPLINRYEELIAENEAKVNAILENDKKVEKVAKETQAKKQKELPKSNEESE